MLTKSIIKYIKSLKEKKNRDQYGTFVVEGNKMVKELVNTIPCQYLISTKEELNNINSNRIENIIEVKGNEIDQVSFLKNPQQMLAVFYQQDHKTIDRIEDKLILVLDEIQDPGNLGTIVRLADWYGIEHIICSESTADIHNPKVIQATMGAFARVKVYYRSLTEFLEQNSHLSIYGTFLDGENIYKNDLTQNGLIIMGNEGNGISKQVEKFVNKKLLIPSYPPSHETSESLNVAIATAIVCAEFRRRLL